MNNMDQFWLDCAEIFRNLALGVSAPFGVLIAWRGLNSWKSEQKWDKSNRLANDLLVGIIKRHDAFRYVRHHPHSIAILFQYSGERIGTEDRNTDWIKEYDERFDVIRAAKKELYPRVVEADVLWGPGIRDLTEKLDKVEYDVLFSLNAFKQFEANLIENAGSEGLPKNFIQALKKPFASTAGDQIELEHRKIVDEIQDFVKKQLEQHK